MYSRLFWWEWLYHIILSILSKQTFQSSVLLICYLEYNVLHADFSEPYMHCFMATFQVL